MGARSASHGGAPRAQKTAKNTGKLSFGPLGPLTAPDGFQIAQDGPKTAEDGSQEGPKAAQDASNTAVTLPTRPKRASKRPPQEGPNRHKSLFLFCILFFLLGVLACSAFRGSQNAQEAPKSAPRRPKRPPKGPQDGPRGPEDGPRAAQDGPIRP